MREGNGIFYAIPILLVLFFGALVFFFMAFDTVDANHIGVKVRFGSILGTMTSGMQYTGLFTHVEEYDMRTRKVVVDMQGTQSSVDKTGQAVYGTIDVNFRIKPSEETVMKLYKEVGSNDAIVDRLNIDPIIREGYKQATSQYDALEVATDKREAVKEEAIELIRLHFPTEYFELQNVVITNIDFNTEFKNAIEAKKVSIQDMEKERNQLEVVKFQQQQKIVEYEAQARQLELQKNQINQLLISQQLIAKWDGHYPQYLIIPSEQLNTFLPMPNLPAQTNNP
jgi:prohibitin 2